MTHSEEPRSTRRIRPWVWWLLALGASVWLLWMTMRPNGVVTRELVPVIRAARILGIPPYVIVDLVGNIVVFVPIGVVLTLAIEHNHWRDRMVFATLLGAVLSLCIELLQLLLPTRVPGVEDWLLNTAGAALGAVVVYLIQTLRIETRRRITEPIEHSDHT